MRKHLLVLVIISPILFTMTTGLSGLVASSTASWTTGGPYGGHVNSLAMAGSNPDVIYAGTGRGVFATIDGGSTWTKRGLPDTWIRVVQVAPDNPDIVYAGTSDGIYKSVDGGTNWTPRNGLSGTLSGARINAVAIDPQNHETLYAGTGRWLQQPLGE
ncbi:MAG: WD40/YVTN/BNR-like repeat-containing protein, partial [Anaerolineales bacterium]